METSDRPNDAADYGPFLERHGAQEVPNADANHPQQYDILVVDRHGPKHTHGHIAIYDGTRWISDYKQNRPIPSGYGPNPVYHIYRFPGN